MSQTVEEAKNPLSREGQGIDGRKTNSSYFMNEVRSLTWPSRMEL